MSSNFFVGPIYREKIGPTEGVFISSPDYMRRVFALEGRHPQHIIPDAWKLYNEIHGQKRGLLFMYGSKCSCRQSIVENELTRNFVGMEKNGTNLGKS